MKYRFLVDRVVAATVTWVLAVGATAILARAASTDVTVNGLSGPWLQSDGLNSSYAYGINDQTSPTVVTSASGISVAPSEQLTIAYLSGTVSYQAGLPSYTAQGDTGFITNDTSNEFGVFPSFDMPSADYPINLVELVGTFADSSGDIVGTPFPIGLSATITVPIGASQLQLGVNDNKYSDNTGSFDVQISGSAAVPVAEAGPSDDAYVTGTVDPTDGGTYTGSPSTDSYQSLTLEAGSSYTLPPWLTLDLDNGNGTLTVDQNSTFSGDGLIEGNVINSGLFRIPIVPLTGPPGTGTNPTGTGGGTILGGDGGGGGVIITGGVTNTGALLFSQPSIGYTANLEVTGTFTQTSTGMLRMFIGGNEQGVDYSHLQVDKAVDLSGQLQVVLEPDLFDFLPTVGETFDVIDSDASITLNPDFSLQCFILASDASYLPGDDLIPYNSGNPTDPDVLLQINPNDFSYALINNGQTLQLTYLGENVVPEPATLSLLALAAPMLLARRRRTYPRDNTIRRA